MKIGKHKYINKDTDLIYNAHHFGLDLKAREIWLVPNDDISTGWGEPIYGDPGVEYSMTSRFLKNLHILMNMGSEPILIHLKTMGGDWNQGIAIYDTIKFCPCFVVAINYTSARSMSSLIFSACDKRVMMPHSTFMFHDGTQAMDGTVKQFLTEAEQCKITRKQMLDIYVGRMKESAEWADKSNKECENWLKRQMDRKEDVFLSPQDAIKHGFADEIFAGDWDSLCTE